MKNEKVMTLRFDQHNFSHLLERFLFNRGKVNEGISSVVQKILSEIRIKGDTSLISMIKKFDKLSIKNLDEIKIKSQDLKKAFLKLPNSQKVALKFAFNRIKFFHEKQIPTPFNFKDSYGVQLGVKFEPINSVGFYIPGGKAIYPSTVLMNAIPALVAGVKKRIMISPISLAQPPQILLAAAYLSKVTEFYAMGGAHSIAALAYGTKTIKKVDKICGPGNIYVSEAKRQVFGEVGIDSIAGPSEILVVSDNKNDPNWIAFDLLSQSEHDEQARAILITDDDVFASKVENCIKNVLEKLPRKKIAYKSWISNGCIIVLKNLKDSVKLINNIAPEHLQLSLDKPYDYFRKITNAGSIFIGRYTPEAIGDYVAGPNHILPTGGTARFSSGLGVSDFFKKSTFIECNKENLPILAEHAAVLAEAEGLHAHKLSMEIRLKSKK